MFNNLIESSSHQRELKRRGSFFLFATACYTLVFAITGIVSVYAYDARLDNQTLSVVTLLPPVDFTNPSTTVPDRPAGHNSGAVSTSEGIDVRRHAIADVNQPTLAPENISTSPNPQLPVRSNVPYRLGGDDSNAGLLSGNRGEREPGRTPGQVVEIITPPPEPTPKPAPKIIRSPKILNSEALELPKPPYPQMAKELHIQGRVTVQVLIDETGKVVSAKALDGHPLLKQVSERAAYQARFSPTMLGEQAVKVSGVITYNFVLQ